MGLIEQIENLGSDDIATFGGNFEGGYHVQQDAAELAGLVDALKAYRVETYLQIGCAAGGTERFICETLGIKELAVIDIGEHPKFPVWIEQNKPALEAQGAKVNQHIGDSHDEAAEVFLATLDREYDIIGIDGDHSPAGVRMDWALIMPYLKPGTLVWFHDIASENLPIGQRGALEVWEKVKARHKVVYETKAKFGIGLVEII
ncbi:MAG: class I SAM-dependent methyltransferase [Fibrobacterota bacterium]|nr:class I SAM-dependent methyltransferase [Fibrobacterota bacterium]